MGSSFRLLEFFLEFLEYLTITFFAFLASLVFSGITDRAMLCFTGTRALTDNENFLMSLVVARSIGTVLAKPKFCGHRQVTLAEYLVTIPECLYVESSNV